MTRCPAPSDRGEAPADGGEGRAADGAARGLATDRADVAVVGGGPVGLFLGAELARLGVHVLVLEKRRVPVQHSRSIGIHPPALEVLEACGATGAMLADGEVARSGAAFAWPRTLGRIRFDSVSRRHPYVVLLPQARTERILEERLEALAPGALVRGAEVARVTPTHDGVELRLRSGGGRGLRVRARVAVGCDGANSFVRRSAGVAMRRRAYPDAYVMGDFPDDTALGPEAAIFLTARGVVESFPLPGAMRRWVVKTARRVDEPTAATVARAVHVRLGFALDASRCAMVSAFGVEAGLAVRFHEGRCALAGDSAHLIPPLGGQGMNLGWLDAADLAARIGDAGLGAGLERALADYDAARRRAAKAALRRADLNLRLGRAGAWDPARNLALRIMLSPLLSGATAKLFAMHGLASRRPRGPDPAPAGAT